jgi:peptide/nickel transport system permease protein
MLFAVSIAVSFGVLAVWKVGSLLDRALMGFLQVLGFSVPAFCRWLCPIYIFAIDLRYVRCRVTSRSRRASACGRYT